MIFIFDCFGGLCNQFNDINTGVSFCLSKNIKFSFRHASFRNKNLVSWYNVDLKELFDIEFLKRYNLYIDFDDLKLDYENTWNLNSNIYINDVLTQNNITTYDNLEDLFKIINKTYYVIKQPWCLNKIKFDNINIFNEIKPNKKMMDIYINIRNNLFPLKEDYNFLHYRYEKDFTDFFNLSNQNIIDIIKKLKFKNKLNIYIASTNIDKLLYNENIDNLDLKLIYKNEKELKYLNFEQKAIIDYMFGLNSYEIYGHSKSSFSILLNNLKNTNNYYDIV